MTVHCAVATAWLGPQQAGVLVDHIDGNHENNCLSNLRYVTPGESNKNLRPAGRGKQFTGTPWVYWDSRGGVFARVKTDHICKRLGRFSTIEAASKAVSVFLSEQDEPEEAEIVTDDLVDVEN